MMGGRRGAFLWLSAFLGVLLVHGVWLSLHQADPVWDMAHHQWMGLRLLHAVADGAPVRELITVSDYYPPLYYLQEAIILGLLGSNPWLPLLANLAGLLTLSYCTYRLASGWLGFPMAEAAGILALLLPMVAWTSRESLLDVALSGWVAASVLVLVRSQWLKRRRLSLLFGLLVAAGMLTKWTFPLFIAPPLVYALFRTRDKHRSCKNLLDALLLALPPVLIWYLPNLDALAGHLRETTGAAELEGDPGALEWRGWIYYPRALVSYYLFLPLTAMLTLGLARQTKKFSRGGRPADASGLLAAWLLGSIFLLTLLQAKDPRYIMPLSAPLALLLVWVWRRSRRAVLTILTLAFLQFLAVSFNTPAGEIKLASLDAAAPFDYRAAAREWVWFQTSYFGELGPPKREDWKLNALLEVIPEDALIGFVPELPRFNTKALLLAAEWKRGELEVVRIGNDRKSLDTLPYLDYAVTKSGSQGIPYLTSFNRQALEGIQTQGWELLRQIELPDRSRAEVWRNPSPAPRDVDPAYAKLRVELQNLVREILPENPRVLTVCRGDDSLLEMLGPTFSHFPQAENGGYLGYHPADSGEAVARLAALRSKGAEYVLFPRTSIWWLDYYSGLERYLKEHGSLLYQNEEVAVIYRLEPD